MVPAVCENPDCRQVFWPILNIKEALNIRGGIARVSDACPYCKSSGIIPHGEYRVVRGETIGELLSEADLEVIRRGLGVVQDAVAGKIQLEDFLAKAKKLVPELSPLWDLLPKTKDQAYQFWMLVLVGLTLYFTVFPPQGEVQAPKEVTDAVESVRHETRVRTRKGQRKQRDKKHRRHRGDT